MKNGSIDCKALSHKHLPLTLKFREFMEDNPLLKAMMEETLSLNSKVNSDRNYNPAQDLESLYDYIDWSSTCLPWNCLGKNGYPSLYNRIDQSTAYFWFIFDQPLKELEGKGYYYPSLNYLEPIKSWFKEYSKAWGSFLDTKESWCDEYYKMALEDNHFNLKSGIFEDPSNWHTFNEFFSRKMKDIAAVRPLGDEEILCPADSYPQGFWSIDKNSMLPESIVVKSGGLRSIKQLIGEDSAYADSFAGGSFTHTFLDIDCYHRFNSPVTGIIKEVRKIEGANAPGGITKWHPETKSYILHDETGFQMIETRSCVIIDTEKFGLVAMIPVGMSQICSVNILETLKPGTRINKGDEVGYFLFGGSDICLCFQKGVKLRPLMEENKDGKYKLMNVRSSMFKLLQ